MRNFLASKNNIALSAYITDKAPSAITTNGALTIIDNSEPSQHITGLVPNSYSIFLDNLFLASGYGFSSYAQFEKASYVISTYANAYSYILNELDILHNRSFTLEFDENSDNKIDEIYNTYGWLKEYKEIKIERAEDIANNYIISLDTIETSYIDEIYIEVFGGKNLQMQQSQDSRDLSFNYFEIGKNATVRINFVKDSNYGGDPILFHQTAPEIRLNVSGVDYSNVTDGLGETILLNAGGNAITNDSNKLYISRDYRSNTFANKDLSFVFKRHKDIIYQYTFKNLLKWRYRIIPFNTELVNIFNSLSSNFVYALDYYLYSDTSFSIDNVNLIQGGSLDAFLTFVESNLNNAIFLDDEMTIEFLGLGYTHNNAIYYMHDYFIVESGISNFDFYFNGIKNNHWSYFEFELNNGTKRYRLYQSPQRYIGKHTWTIKYNYE